MTEQFLDKVHNYTKYKVIEMLINKHKDAKLDNLNEIEQIAEDIIDVLGLVGAEFYYNRKR
jgi:hypothetical protein